MIKQATDKKIVVVAVDQAVSEPTAYVPPTTRSPTAAWAPSGWPSTSAARATSSTCAGSTACRRRRPRQGLPGGHGPEPGHQDQGGLHRLGLHQGRDIAVQELGSGNYDGVWTSGIDYTVVNAFKTVGKARPGRRGRQQPVHPAAAGGHPGAAVTNPAVIGGVGTAIALDVLSGKTVERETLLTPEVWDAEQDKATLEANSFPDRDATFSSAVSVKPYTTYTNEQLFACKGPGE